MNTSYIITPMDAETVRKVAALEEACFSMPWSQQALEDVLQKPEYLYLTACGGEELLGYGGVYFAADEANITNIAVNPSFRNQGVAQAILQGILEEAVKRGAATVYLEVRHSNAVARHVYERCGFVLLGIRKGFYSKPTEDGYIYGYKLNE